MLQDKTQFPVVQCQISEAKLESYLFELMPAQIAGRIFDESIEAMEDHILVCPSCLKKSEDHLSIVQALRRFERHSGSISKATAF